MTDASLGQGFPSLMRLLRGDSAKVRRLLLSFATGTREDLERMRAANAAGNRQQVSELAHRLKSACAQLDAADAAHRLEQLESFAQQDGATRSAFDALATEALDEVQRVLARVDAWLARDEARRS